MRQEIKHLLSIGPFPNENSADPKKIKEIQELLSSLQPPVSDQEAKALVNIFGDDSCFGLAWTLLHLIETAPNWPIIECFEKNPSNPWIDLLKNRAYIK